MSNLSRLPAKINSHDAQRQFIDAMLARELELSDQLEADGKLHYCDATNKKGSHGKNDGRYVFHPDGWPAGAFKNYTDGGGWTKWKYRNANAPLSAEEKTRLVQQARKAQAIASKQRYRKRKEAQNEAQRRWKKLPDADADHPYLRRKNIGWHGLRVYRGLLIVPLRDHKGTIWTYQSIDEDGRKLFLKDGRVAGCFHLLKADDDGDQRIFVCEGFATGATVHEITGGAVYIAFDSGNLLAVARVAKDKHPDATIVIVADDDWQVDGNPGMTAATKAAAEIGALLAVPTFRDPTHRQDDDTDFNDMALIEGDEAARQALNNTRQPERDKPSDEGDEDRPLVVRAIDSFEYRTLDWLWYPFIPLGMITGLLGDGEVGKSTVMIDVTASISQRRALPRFGNEDATVHDGSVIILSKEEDISRVIRPRLEAADADLSRVFTIGYDAPNDPDNFDPLATLDGMANALQQKIDEIGNSRAGRVKLIWVDPITDYSGKTDIYKDDQVRVLLGPLTRLAARNDLAIVLIEHFNKKTDQPAKYRGMGSVGFRNVARSVVVIAPSQDYPDERLMMQEKKNYTPPNQRAVKFSFQSVRGGYARIKWQTDWQDIGSVDEVLDGKKQTKQVQAAKLLHEQLLNGPIESDAIDAMAKANGISQSTMRLARATVGVKSFKDGSVWKVRLLPRTPEAGEED